MKLDSHPQVYQYAQKKLSACVSIQFPYDLRIKFDLSLKLFVLEIIELKCHPECNRTNT